MKAQQINSEALNTEISQLNDAYKYEESIIKLEEILHNKKSQNYDRYNAYLQKALTFKRLYNYPEVLENLDLAFEEAKDTDFVEEAEVRVLTEKMFVEFDLRNFDKAEKLIKDLSKKNIDLLDAETQAFYLSAVAVLQIINKNYNAAQLTLEDAIGILERKSPKHLPLIYTKIIGLSEHLKDKNLAQNAFDKGIHYAEKYNMDIYKISLYYTMSHFFLTFEDYKNAYLYENQGVEISARYNAAFQNGKLSVLERNLLNKRKNVELDYQKKIKYILAFASAILLAFLVVVVKLYQSNREKNKLILRENNRMRAELEKLTSEVNEQGEDKINLANYNLTDRQIDIVNLVKLGKTNKEIGEKLYISENTVKYHLKIIYSNLGIENRWNLRESLQESLS
ncbi:regulatory protein, luxR family [Soonwooa buanensis]|uniref:Regulatory protein, luxR family n=1 Tax=Soonwooa buanensis TaxID=619805 RepID=A0A1T5EIS3_9FLAO|nr:LuxR C-terminal-related transcriptional regulator [Soonwooa buanensis]SKB83779.1 regulatory protein, luxR family [Soonwooa buanensis]